MEYFGKSESRRVRIKSAPRTKFLERYVGQECDATFYEKGMNAHINSEQLRPPLPKWQSAFPEDLEVLDAAK